MSRWLGQWEVVGHCRRTEPWEGRITEFITKIGYGQWGEMKAERWPQACVLVGMTA